MTALLFLLLTAGVEPQSRLETYQSARTALESRRLDLAADAKHHPAKARQLARRTLLDYLEQSAFPAWKGTPWAFYGTTTTPGEGTIACGYFVTTVFEQAGFKIDRVLLAQQASTWLVTTFARGSKVERLTPKDNADAVTQIRKRFGDDALVVIGFDYHVGLLRLDGDRAEFCHSSFIEPASVTCEDPIHAGAFASSVYVVADALNDVFLDDWLAGRAVKSVLPAKPRRE
ncbi:MAG: hypothetical protein U0228_38725 [Myxococcaceae bacterium]